MMPGPTPPARDQKDALKRALKERRRARQQPDPKQRETGVRLALRRVAALTPIWKAPQP